MANKTDLIVYENKANLPAVVADDGLHAYLEKIKQFPVLSEAEEMRLVKEFKEKGDLQAAQKLITSHLRLAVKIALTYRRYGLPTADLISEANLGLMQSKNLMPRKKCVYLLMLCYGLRQLSMILCYARGHLLKSARWQRRKSCSTIWDELRLGSVYMIIKSWSRKWLSKLRKSLW